MLPNDTPIPVGMCQCGCGRTTTIATETRPDRGHARDHPHKFCRGHRPNANPPYVVDPVTGCWMWQRKRTKDGYGQVWHNGRYDLAHRVIYEREIGPIPPGLKLDHVVCDTPPCVNPGHVRPATNAQNIQRSRAAKVNPGMVNAIREARASGRMVKDLATDYDLHPHTIYMIVTRKSWRNV